MKEALSLDTIENLKVIDVTFTKAIATGDRGFCSQILMSQLRNLIERVMFLCVFKGKDADKDFSYQNIENAISVIYWTPECEHKVLSSMILRDSKQDANILRHMTRLKELK